jgi:A/G-specific adenine glycosylase
MHKTAAEFRRGLVNWYQQHQRDLPWRLAAQSSSQTHPDPYLVLVSEAMLQQTQVATVIPYFQRFISRYPTVKDLALADEQEVLRLWQGLGYYSRARNLLGTAKIIHKDFRGQVPSKVDELLKLPGIGRYTAGAIASLAFGRRAPILDGNVARVLCRIDCIREDPRKPEVRERLWERAEELLPNTDVASFNSALMELGATVCTPKAPKCLHCPVRGHCESFSAGVVDQVPATAPAKARPVEKRWTFCIQRENDFMIEQRPAKGRWASMWQFVTVEAGEDRPTRRWIRQHVGIPVGEAKVIGQITHDLTHRRYEFEVFRCRVAGSRVREGVWSSLERLSDYPLPRPHVRIAELLGQMGCG